MKDLEQLEKNIERLQEGYDNRDKDNYDISEFGEGMLFAYKALLPLVKKLTIPDVVVPKGTV